MVRGLTLDAETLTMLANGDDRVRAHARAMHRNGVLLVVPANVVAETTTGRADDAVVNRVVNAAVVQVVDESLARRAGALRLAAGSDATVDATVVATAELHGGWLLAVGPDVHRLAEHAGVQVHDPR